MIQVNHQEVLIEIIMKEEVIKTIINKNLMMIIQDHQIETNSVEEIKIIS